MDNKYIKKEQVDKVIQKKEEPAKAKVETVEQHPLIGLVHGCNKLNMRAKPSMNSQVLKVLEKGTMLMVDEKYKNDTWVSVRTEHGNPGYCMKKFVNVE